jgi:hypothetical protein
MSTVKMWNYDALARASVVATALLTLVGCGGPSTDGADDGGPPNACQTPTGPGIEHSSTISSDETWAAADGPHVVTFGIDVAPGARLTIEPCSQVRIRGGYSLVVEGELVAEGTAETPIEFVADDSTQPWGAIQVFAPGTVSLAYATLEDGGGDTSNAYAALEARGDQYSPAQEILHVDHVTVDRSSAYGVSLRAGGAFTSDSRDLVVTGSSKAPLRILPRLASNVPTGSYTGNAVDVIAIETEAYGDVTLEDVTLHDRGVPYRVGDEVTLGDFIVRGDTTRVALTVEPGTILQFKADARLEIDNDSAGAALVAAGTPDAPIVFTSAAATPAAGDWAGVVFGGAPDAQSRLEHVEIRYAGGASMADSFHCEPDGAFSLDENGAVSIYGEPGSEFITDSLVADSGRLGVNLAYDGSFVDFQPTNEFVDVPGCDVSWPRDLDGNCPASSPCR